MVEVVAEVLVVQVVEVLPLLATVAHPPTLAAGMTCPRSAMENRTFKCELAVHASRGCRGLTCQIVFRARRVLSRTTRLLRRAKVATGTVFMQVLLFARLGRKKESSITF